MSKTTKSSKILEKAGWQEGKGLGRNEQGEVDHVKVQQKDGVLGIGYNAQVSQVWSEQSVRFADVLSKFKAGGDAAAKKKKEEEESSDDDDDEDDAPVQRKSGPAGGKHSVLFDKRRKLKTEGLTSDAGKNEILAHSKESGSRRQRFENTSSDDDSDDDSPKARAKREKAKATASTLTSPLLRRMTERCVTHEPKKQCEEDARVDVKMPEPKPPKSTDSPFRYKRE